MYMITKTTLVLSTSGEPFLEDKKWKCAGQGETNLIKVSEGDFQKHILIVNL